VYFVGRKEFLSLISEFILLEGFEEIKLSGRQNTVDLPLIVDLTFNSLLYHVYSVHLGLGIPPALCLFPTNSGWLGNKFLCFDPHHCA